MNRANRAAKPQSNGVSFGCSKFFVSVDTDERRFTCGMQVERGYIRASRDERAFRLCPDWDWHRFVAGLTPRARLYQELKRLVEADVRATKGVDLIEAMMAVFEEVRPLMNACMQVPIGR